MSYDLYGGGGSADVERLMYAMARLQLYLVTLLLLCAGYCVPSLGMQNTRELYAIMLEEWV